MRIKKIAALLVVLLLPAISIIAQDKCATVQLMDNKRKFNTLKETDDQFESWIAKRKSAFSGRANASETYTIPVVVHIIHKGEALGSGVNISDDQILSQVKVLNRDFRRTNTDASNTPSEFQSVAGSININFVLAKQDPDGAPTTGIVRKQGSKNTWSINDETTLKSQSFWPSEDYLNIWVTDLSSTLLGYAQFPVSGLAGLEDADDNRLTDGVVIDYAVFGSSDDGTFNLLSDFHTGRTATHEVGHFFGLRHIWGDDNGSCSGNGDYVTDTPNQGANTTGCPSHPQSSCNVHTMFQNYMDYTNDECMNLFTVGQVERIATVIENSPRRVSLLSSTGAVDPSPVENDLRIVSVNVPSTQCSEILTPAVSVINQGTNSVSKFSVAVWVKSTIHTETIELQAPLLPGDATTVSLSSITVDEGSSTVQYEIKQTNGFDDGKAEGNTAESLVYRPFGVAIPHIESFNTFPVQWYRDADGITTWALAAANGSAVDNSLVLNFFAATADGESEALITPSFQLPSNSESYVVFDVAYAQSSSLDQDGLKVYLLSDCSDDLAQAQQLYFKQGSSLATTSTTSSSFVPSTAAQWRQEVIDLSSFQGSTNVRLAFVGVSDQGNNVFIDEVKIVGPVQTDVAIAAILNPSPVICGVSTDAIIKIENKGFEAITELKVAYIVNDGIKTVQSFSNLNLAPAQSTEISIVNVTLAEGKNELEFTLLEPNGLFDTQAEDNDFRIFSYTDGGSDFLPLRQNFEAGFQQWVNINPAGGRTWDFASTNYTQSIVFNAAAEDTISKAWLVSPTLDMSYATEASMFFDMSVDGTVDGSGKTGRETVSDVLQILVSDDCGKSYHSVLSDTIKTQSEALGIPTTISQWKKRFVDLSVFAGQSSVRVAFVFSSAGINSVYLDNINFFLSDDPSPVSISEPYAIYGTDPTTPNDFLITFNLETRSSISYTLLDLQGRTILSQHVDDVLNQTFQVFPNVSGGIYVLRLQIGGKWYQSRLYLND